MTVAARDFVLLITLPALGQIRVVNIGIEQVKLKLKLVGSLANRLPAVIRVIATLEHLDELEDEVGIVSKMVQLVAYVLLLELLVMFRVVPLGVMGAMLHLGEVFVLAVFGVVFGRNDGGDGGEAGKEF